jgi:hypothetical protein
MSGSDELSVVDLTSLPPSYLNVSDATDTVPVTRELVSCNGLVQDSCVRSNSGDMAFGRLMMGESVEQ